MSEELTATALRKEQSKFMDEMDVLAKKIRNDIKADLIKNSKGPWNELKIKAIDACADEILKECMNHSMRGWDKFNGWGEK